MSDHFEMELDFGIPARGNPKVVVSVTANMGSSGGFIGSISIPGRNVVVEGPMRLKALDLESAKAEFAGHCARSATIFETAAKALKGE